MCERPKRSDTKITRQTVRRESRLAPRAPRQQIDIHPAKERSFTVTADDPTHSENRNAHNGYPPDLEDAAVQTVLQQAEVLSDRWAA